MVLSVPFCFRNLALHPSYIFLTSSIPYFLESFDSKTSSKNEVAYVIFIYLIFIFEVKFSEIVPLELEAQFRSFRGQLEKMVRNKKTKNLKNKNGKTIKIPNLKNLKNRKNL
ncbi:hypothetical protein MsAg5_08460 [Methanosarcinaceae archaeon Ag5]|uniref:Uncharacterized protein n=1 Tax=Methanolapillus africanus TaxID=3028297 RepID=A0AAE4SDV4_9EURY|nr:hypothetical protein [Methanosarcinaceae archaeon Ag5]